MTDLTRSQDDSNNQSVQCQGFSENEDQNHTNEYSAL